MLSSRRGSHRTLTSSRDSLQSSMVMQVALQKQAQTARFKLESAVDSLCQPLNDMLKKVYNAKKHEMDDEVFIFGTEEWTTTDFLIYGHLSLLLFSNVPDRSVEDQDPSHRPLHRLAHSIPVCSIVSPAWLS